MPPHRQEFGPFSFEAPSEWSRRVLLVLAGPAPGSTNAPIVVVREQRASGEALATFAWRRLFEMTRGTPERRVVDAGATELGERSAFRAALRWSAPPGEMREALAWIDGGDGSVLVVTSTSREKEPLEALDALLSSLRFGAMPAASQPVPSGPRSSPPPPGEDGTFGGYPDVPMPGARPMRR